MACSLHKRTNASRNEHWMVFVFWCRQSTSNSLTLTAAPHSDPLCKYNTRVYINRKWHKKSTERYYYGIIPCCLFLCEAIRLLWFARLALWTFLWSRFLRTCFSCPCPLECPGIDSNHTKSVKTHLWNLFCIKQNMQIYQPHLKSLVATVVLASNNKLLEFLRQNFETGKFSHFLQKN